MSAEIVGIFISPVPKGVEKPRGGFPMVQVESAELVEGKGIKSTDGQDDRYFGFVGEQLKGAYPNNKVRQLSLIVWDAIERANNGQEIPFTWAETRRNIVIAGISAEELNELKDKLFQLGNAEVLGTELCDPCDRPDKLSGKKRISRLKLKKLQNHYRMERDRGVPSISLRASLSKYITPDLGIQLLALKEHLGINSFIRD